MRDNDCIEQMIRDAWSPSLPDGMRERVLMRTRERYAQTARIGSRRRRGLLWLAAATVAFVLMANLIDVARSARLSGIVGLPGIETPARSGAGIPEQRHEMERLLALSPGSGLNTSL